jgi:hypothetical protein
MSEGASRNDREISISLLKEGFSKKFPLNPLTRILLTEPDTMNADSFIAKAGTWLAIIQAEKRSRSEVNENKS